MSSLYSLMFFLDIKYRVIITVTYHVVFPDSFLFYHNLIILFVTHPLDLWYIPTHKQLTWFLHGLIQHSLLMFYSELISTCPEIPRNCNTVSEHICLLSPEHMDISLIRIYLLIQMLRHSHLCHLCWTYLTIQIVNL